MAGFPKESHNGCKLWGVGEEGLKSLMPEHGPEGIFDVGGYKDMVRACSGERREVVDHFVGT